MTGPSPDQMALDGRAAQFRTVITNTEFTSGDGSAIATERAIDDLVRLMRAVRDAGRHVLVVGNGGSAAVASHAVVDFVNVASIKAMTLHESSTLTCLANDYGFDVALARQVATFSSMGDLLIAISSSGKSANIRNAASAMREAGGSVFSLSGFAADNSLRKLGDTNAWVPSDDYGFVEIAHQFILHNISDRLRPDS